VRLQGKNYETRIILLGIGATVSFSNVPRLKYVMLLDFNQYFIRIY